MNNFKKAARILSNFKWCEGLSFASVTFFLKTEVTNICRIASMAHGDDILSWKEKEWEAFMRKDALIMDEPFRITDVLSMTLCFQKKAEWERYTIECVSLKQYHSFNRVILPTAEFIFARDDKVSMLAMPFKEFFFRPDEQKLINSCESVILACKMVAPERLKTIDSTLPYILKEKEEFRLIPWPDFFD